MKKIASGKATYIFLTIIVLASFISLILFPEEVFEASKRGIHTWGTIVLPALFPFFVLSEVLINLGIVNLFGILLEPLMRPLFRLPGASAFVLAVGFTSGAPISSIITADLRKKHIISRNEAERLICFTNNASPLFIFGAISVGMLGNPEVGIIIAASHYLANICIGLFLRFFYNKKDMHHNSQVIPFKRKLKNHMYNQTKENIAIGKTLGHAVKNSIYNISQIGGFIIIFSVIIELLNISGITHLMSTALALTFKSLALDMQLTKGIATGLIEMTLGSKLIAESTSSFQLKISAISLIIGWSGLSIHAQVLSMISKTDIRFYPFIVARICHGIIAILISLVIYKPAISVITSHIIFSNDRFSILSLILSSWIFFISILFLFLVLAILLMIVKKLKTILYFLYH